MPIPSKPTKNIVELAQGNAGLSTLVTALTAGKLVSALQGTGPFTVFAPSNAAFAKLPQQELTRLFNVNYVQDLVGILKYHVVSGAAVYSKDLKASQNVKTLAGEDVLIEKLSQDHLLTDIRQAIHSGVELWCVCLCQHWNQCVAVAGRRSCAKSMMCALVTKCTLLRPCRLKRCLLCF